MTRIAEIADRLHRLAKRREDEGIYTDAALCEEAAAYLSAALAHPLPLKEEVERAASYAEGLAAALWEKHWKEDSPDWKPLSGDLIGILTQIDNMTTGLSRLRAGAQEGWQLVPEEPTPDMLIAAGTIEGWNEAATEHADKCHIDWWRAMLAAAPSPEAKGGPRP